jgi:hypothetical protein
LLGCEESFVDDYYVYVCIDPRNFEEFYFGKGRGSRKDAHLSDDGDSEKARRIAAIKRADLEPIIRVIARDLSEHDAFLVEKTLLWKLGKQLTNQASGHYADNFRPHDTMHRRLSGFDFRHGLYYFNVGDGTHRSWEDCANHGFISAGQGLRWRDAILGFNEGDVLAAYLKNHGFVGIGRVTQPARRINEVAINGRRLLDLDLSCPRMAENCDSAELSEYVALVQWIAAVTREQAKWQPKSGLYTTTHVRASLDGQPRTIAFLEQSFDVNLRALVV